MDGYMGEIRLFAGDFAPKYWAFCNGQLLAIAQNQALFSLLGTTYGGNGQTTFALPDLKGRVPVGVGQGPGLSSVNLGDKFGAENVTLIANQLPIHSHSLNASGNGPTINTAEVNLLASQARANGGTMPDVYAANSGPVAMGSSAIGNTGGNQPFSIRQPHLGLNYVICLSGLYPSRN